MNGREYEPVIIRVDSRSFSSSYALYRHGQHFCVIPDSCIPAPKHIIYMFICVCVDIYSYMYRRIHSDSFGMYVEHQHQYIVGGSAIEERVHKMYEKGQRTNETNVFN